MYGFHLGAAVLGVLVVLSVCNYRWYVPGPKVMGQTANKVDVQKLKVKYGGHRLYGELTLPPNHSGRLPTVICSHGLEGPYRYFRKSVGMSLSMCGRPRSVGMRAEQDVIVVIGRIIGKIIHHQYGSTPSMSRHGNPYNDAMTEKFFSILKTECICRIKQLPFWKPTG